VASAANNKLTTNQVVALITVEVHARDVIDRLVKAGASSPNDFEWASQLRFYWDRDANDVVAKQAGAAHRLGCCVRLMRPLPGHLLVAARDRPARLTSC
jgi:hypothetical protein